jgi:uncharacterized protein YdeI (YjbR/CyaY-like superfamily)
MGRKTGSETDPRFFKSLDAFRTWLEANHAARPELWVGLYKRASGKTGISYKESVDAALCYGWIDGVRKSVNGVAYKIRFTPRRPTSIWSAVNLKRIRELETLDLVADPGLKAFRERDPKKQNIYSFENRPRSLPPRFLRLFGKSRSALSYYRSQPPWYQRTSTWWVVSAKQEETRVRRLEILIERSEKGEWIGPLKRTASKPKRPA